jgi:cytochrome b561
MMMCMMMIMIWLINIIIITSKENSCRGTMTNNITDIENKNEKEDEKENKVHKERGWIEGKFVLDMDRTT